MAGGRVLGFFINYKSKTMINATSYFPSLLVFTLKLKTMCPVTAFIDLVSGHLFEKRFLKKRGGVNALPSFLTKLAGDEITVSPHALRIGCRTYYLSNNLDKQFVDFLGTWANPEASARYYRASPDAVLRRLQHCFMCLNDWHAIN